MSKSTNEQIADLLATQTYAERIEMAEAFRDYINTWADDQPADARVDGDLFAFWLECYVEAMDLAPAVAANAA